MNQAELPLPVRKKPFNPPRWFWPLISMLSLLAFWTIIAFVKGLFSSNNPIPLPWEVFQQLIEFLNWPVGKQDPYYDYHIDKYPPAWYTLGLLGSHIWQSFIEVTIGFVVALIIALFLGFWSGFSRNFREFITPLNGVFMSIPAIAWAPLMVLVIPNPFVAIVLVVYIAAVSPMIISITEGVLTIKGQEVRVARALGANPHQLFKHVYLPASLPFITAGMRIGFSQAWRALVAAEMIGALGKGLGFMLKTADEIGNDKAMMLCVVLIGLLSFMFERLIFRNIEKRYEVWRLH